MAGALDDKVVIVGAGCFGVSTAYHLLKRGFTDITILDRSPNLPASDAASNDMNRVVRSSYSDIFYSKLAREAITAWKDRNQWRNTYHESGVLVLEAIRACLPIKVPTATFEGNTGYLNTEGGWADAEQGVAIMIAMVVSLGCKVLPGKPVKRISKNKDGKTNGVECEDGTFYAAATVVIATGSWTSSAFPDISPSHTTGLSTGRQCVAMIQLNEEEAALYGGVPVIANFGTGFYIFPPTSKGIIKMGMHLPGYTHTKGGVSTPRTITDSHSGGLLIPKHNVREIRTNLRNVYPKLAEKPFFATRLCWYNDSPDGNWIIGQVPGDSSLILATAGSGHAYKFLPVIGRLVADAVDGTIQPDVAAKFSIERSYIGTDESRSGAPVVELDLDQLCTPEDLQANTLSRL